MLGKICVYRLRLGNADDRKWGTTVMLFCPETRFTRVTQYNSLDLKVTENTFYLDRTQCMWREYILYDLQ